MVWLREGSNLNSLKPEVNRPELGVGEKEEVDVITIDKFCADNDIHRIDLLKVDVEGYEKEVLQGAERMLASHAIRFIYAETTFLSDDLKHMHISELTGYLEPLGYRFLSIYAKRLRFDCTVSLLS